MRHSVDYTTLIQGVVKANGETRLHKKFAGAACYSNLKGWLEAGYDFDAPSGRYSLRLIAKPLNPYFRGQ